MKQRPPKRFLVSFRGFSLVEMMLCCTVLGLLCLVGAQTLRGLIPSARVNRAVGEVASLLEWTRWKAVQEGRVFKVVFDSLEEKLTVYREEQRCGGEAENSEVIGLDLRKSHTGIVLGASESTYRTSGCRYVDESGVHLRDNTIRFLPSGTPDRCGSFYLLPRDDFPDRQDRTVAVSLLLSTGRLQRWRYDPVGDAGCPHGGAWNPS